MLWRIEHKTIFSFLGAYEDAQFIAQRKDESGSRLSRALVLKAQVSFIMKYRLTDDLAPRLCLLLGTGSMHW